MPFMFMIFFSTTFSPGSGVNGLKELRYLFTRFYLFCSIPAIQDSMEGCPDNDLNTLYLILSGLIFTVFFVAYKVFHLASTSMKKKKVFTQKSKLKDDEFRDLQVELYGESVLLKNSLSGTNHSTSTPRNHTVPDFNVEEFA